MRCFTCLVLVSLNVPLVLAADDSTATMQAVHDLAVANFDKFPFGTMRITLQTGTAASAADARAGRLEHLVAAPCNYRYDGKGHAFYDCRYSLEALQQATKWVSSTSSTSMLDSFQGVTNGEFSVVEAWYPQADGTALSGATSTMIGEEGFYGRISVPLGLGVPIAWRSGTTMMMSHLIRKDTDIRLRSIDLKALHEGRACAKFTQGNNSGSSDDWIDLERGAIIVCSRSGGPSGGTYEFYADEIEFVPGHGWLPRISTTYLNSSRVFRLVLDSYDFDTPPRDDAFNLNQVRPIPLVHPVTGVNAPLVRTINLDRLPASFRNSRPGTATPPGQSAAVLTPGERVAQPAPPPLTPAPPPGGELAEPPTTRWPLWGGAALGIIALGGTFYYYRVVRR